MGIKRNKAYGIFGAVRYFSFHFILVIVYHSQKNDLCDTKTILAEFVHISYANQLVATPIP